MSRYIVDATLVLIFSRCPGLQKFDLRSCCGVTNTVLRAICTYGRALKKLNLHRCFFHPRSLSFTSPPCTSLNQLWVEDSNLTQTELVRLACLFPNVQILKLDQIRREGLISILTCCPLITFCSVALNEPLHDEQVDQLTQGWSGIETLELRDSEMDQPVMSEHAILNLIKERPLLQELRFTDAFCNFGDLLCGYEVEVGCIESRLSTLAVPSATAQLLTDLAQLSPNLANLGIVLTDRQLPSPTDAVLSGFMQGMDIFSLVLGNCPHITSKDIGKLQAMERIVFTDLRNVSDNCLERLANNSPELNTVVLERCHGLTIEVLMEIAQHCPKLTEIQFQSFGKEQVNFQIAATICFDIKNMCPNLQKFIVNGIIFVV